MKFLVLWHLELDGKKTQAVDIFSCDSDLITRTLTELQEVYESEVGASMKATAHQIVVLSQ